MDIDIPLWLIVLLYDTLAKIAGLIGTRFLYSSHGSFAKLFKGTAKFYELLKSLSLTAILFIVLIPFYANWLAITPESLLVVVNTGPLSRIFPIAI